MSESTSPYQQYVTTPDKLIGFLEEKDQEITKLQRILYNLQKAQFGSKTEKLSLYSDKQLSLLETPEVEAPTLPESKVTVPAHSRKARVKRDLSKLPTTEIVLEPESTVCACCGKELCQIGKEDVSLELEYQPAKLSVNKYVRNRYACGSCKKGVVQAELPENVKPLYRSIASAKLLSHVIVAKYQDHLPLHRQEQIFARLGFEIPRKSLCDWVGGVVDEYLNRLWVPLKEESLQESYLLGDETTLKVQDGVKEGKCHTGYLWGMVAPLKRIVVFEYAPSRAGEVARKVFDGFKGTLQTDAYAGYNPVLLPDAVERIACLAHVRRKFIDAGKSCAKEVNIILQMIAELYRLEKQWGELEADERLIQRQKKSVLVLKKLEEYLRALAQRTLPRAPLMEAIKYTLNQWREIERIFEDGSYHLDNNMIEREMRPIALGRKNYLFAGSHEGAKRAAVIYSLMATARLHKVNPFDWLTDVLKRMRSHHVNKLSELLPQNWIPLTP